MVRPLVGRHFGQPVDAARLADHRRIGSQPADGHDQRRLIELVEDSLLQRFFVGRRQAGDERGVVDLLNSVARRDDEQVGGGGHGHEDRRPDLPGDG